MDAGGPEWVQRKQPIFRLIFGLMSYRPYEFFGLMSCSAFWNFGLSDCAYWKFCLSIFGLSFFQIFDILDMEVPQGFILVWYAGFI